MAARLDAEYSEPRLALDKCKDVALPMGALEHHQIALPMAKGSPLPNFGRALGPGVLSGNE